MAETDFVAPIMPTGFGVADLEIAREQDALASAEAEPASLDRAPLDDTARDAQAESEAHPS